MDTSNLLVAQAHRLDEDQKELAKHIYRNAVRLMTHASLRRVLNANQRELAQVFVQLWMRSVDASKEENVSNIALAKIAFNYANLTLGINGGFLELARKVNDANQLIDDGELQVISDGLNFVLTDTGIDDPKFTNH